MIPRGKREGFQQEIFSFWKTVEKGSTADLPATEVLEVDLILMLGTLSNMGKQPIM